MNLWKVFLSLIHDPLIQYGRQKGMSLFILGAAVCFSLNAFLQRVNYIAFAFIQMVLVAFANASCLTYTVYGIEFIGPKYRTAGGIFGHAYFSLGFMILSPVALVKV